MELDLAMKWSLEPATRGVGTWLVGRCARGVEVIAAPGTRIPAAEAHSRSRQRLVGWQQVWWYHKTGGRLNLDRDPPDGEVRVVDTCRVLDTVDVRLHASVQLLLEDCLVRLEDLDRRLSITLGPVCELSEHRDLETIDWVRSQLNVAFPVRARRPRDPVMRMAVTRASGEPAAQGQSLDVSCEASVATQQRARDYPLGGRELARLLKRRMIWRSLELFPRRMLVVLLACHRDGDLGELAENNLARRAWLGSR
jgi:hypothetical protein